MAEPSFHLRRAGVHDLEALAAADPRLAGDGRRRQTVRALLALGDGWLAEADGRVMGYVLVSHHFFSRPFIDLLVVGEAARRHGVGTALMDQCERAHTDDRIFTSTNESNDPMRRLLAKASWTPTGIIENLDPGDPELVFVKFRAG